MSSNRPIRALWDGNAMSDYNLDTPASRNQVAAALTNDPQHLAYILGRVAAHLTDRTAEQIIAGIDGIEDANKAALVQICRDVANHYDWQRAS